MATARSMSAPARGPLRVHPDNPRYFTDASGRAVYLTGSHTWNNLQDMGRTDPPPAFDFAAYLDFLERLHHNFIRLWRWELLTWDTRATGEHAVHPPVHIVAPHPWARTGPGAALDGKPKFNLMIRFIHDEEKRRPRQHPVGMTFQYQGGTRSSISGPGKGRGLRDGRHAGRVAPNGSASRPSA